MNKRTWYLPLAVVMLLCICDTDVYAQRHKKKEVKEVSIYDIDTLIQPVPRNRQLWHQKIDKEQKRADASDGAIDKFIYYSDDTVINNMLTRAFLHDVDHMQKMIENLPMGARDAVADNQGKIRYLRALNGMIAKYNADTHIDPYFYRKLVFNMHDMIIAHYEGRGMEFVRANINFQTLDNAKEMFESNSPERSFIYTEMGKREPQIMIQRLSEFANESYADDVVASAARVVPNYVFNYASSTNYTLSNAVRRSKDPLVQTIVQIAQQSKVPLKAMPFLNDIYTKKKTIAEIDAIAANQDLYFQNLVRLKVENVELGGDTYTDELKYRGLKYVREMNDLHEEKDPVRFKCIDGFAPEVLYFIMVYGQDEIYTSSFLGTFNRMMERMKPMKGDELLAKVNRDKFRTFIRMCAGYNTLSTFLGTMDPDKKTGVMRDFVAGLEKGKDNDLEDAVDVADAFGSIADTALSDFLQKEVTNNYEKSYDARSKKGVIVYGLLATLFEGSRGVDSENVAATQSEKLNLPPINLVRYKNLVSDSGVVFEQFFFYGDEDGKNSYASFLGNFKDKTAWKKVDTKYWTTISSIKGKPITIYANLPLAEPEDEEAQRALAKYLDEASVKPTVVVHRGHSYHLPLTMDRLQKENRIVMLGSCGGYHNLGTVLDHAPDANIISSKQVGAMSINEPIIKAINDQLLAGNDIDWITTWKSLNGYFEGKGKVKEMFDDYIPPHKNLGAIFIKAYRRMFNSDTN